MLLSAVVSPSLLPYYLLPSLRIYNIQLFTKQTPMGYQVVVSILHDIPVNVIYKCTFSLKGMNS